MSLPNAECMSFADLINEIALGTFVQKSAPPSSAKLITQADFNTYVNSDGTLTSTTQIPSYGDCLAHRTGGSATLTTANFSANGSTYRYDSINKSCSGPFAGNSGTTSTASGTKAPTANTTQITLTFNSNGVNNSGATYTLKNPSGAVVLTGTVPTTTTSQTYFAVGAAAGAYTLTFASLGTQACASGTGIDTTNYASFSGSLSWYQ